MEFPFNLSLHKRTGGTFYPFNSPTEGKMLFCLLRVCFSGRWQDNCVCSILAQPSFSLLLDAGTSLLTVGTLQVTCVLCSLLNTSGFQSLTHSEFSLHLSNWMNGWFAQNCVHYCWGNRRNDRERDKERKFEEKRQLEFKKRRLSNISSVILCFHTQVAVLLRALSELEEWWIHFQKCIHSKDI